MVYPRDPETVEALRRIQAAIERLEKVTVKLWRKVAEYVEELRKARKGK